MALKNTTSFGLLMRALLILPLNALGGLAVGGIVGGAVWTVVTVVLGQELPFLTAWRVGFWIFFPILLTYALLVNYRDTLKPAFAIKRTYKTTFAFALENLASSSEFIRFRLARPAGYEPHDIRQYSRWIHATGTSASPV